MEQAFNQALINSRVIHGAIKAAGIYHYRMDYQDFVQDGIINYANVYHKYAPQEEMTKINQLAFQKNQMASTGSTEKANEAKC
ncbi:hypothetical protein [Holzapfeliella floricola]|uniref:hypothetical protein n=1 Tax=Holzapfeliella floricola TaxID=679249 RepID=UPI0007846E0D|nr:hypothetical protein [Holzapfeliella floricola]